MQRNRADDIKKRQEENRKLQQDTKKMEAQLQNLRKIKQEQLMYLIHNSRKQLQSLKMQQKEQQIKKQPSKLRNYGTKVVKVNEQKIKKQLIKKKLEQSSESDKQDDDGSNLLYFLQVLKMQQYFESFKANKILSLAKLRNLKEAQLKSVGIPIKDHVKIIKKLREMGF